MTENPEIGAVTGLKSRVKEGGSMMHDGNERKGKKIFCSYPTFSDEIGLCGYSSTQQRINFNSESCCCGSCSCRLYVVYGAEGFYSGRKRVKLRFNGKAKRRAGVNKTKT
jgi:hypothetical protein